MVATRRVYSFRFYVASGCLVSYGIDQLETVREAACHVDRILRGANPGDLPVQLPIGELRMSLA
ncbi:MAG: ABC transporter substrate binding protein [Pseudolabrys sp.]